jgi:hypothetical protein
MPKMFHAPRTARRAQSESVEPSDKVAPSFPSPTSTPEQFRPVLPLEETSSVNRNDNPQLEGIEEEASNADMETDETQPPKKVSAYIKKGSPHEV